SDRARSIRALSVERSNLDPGTSTTHISILGNKTSLAVYTNGSYASAVFTKDPITDKRDQLQTNYDLFTFNGIDKVKITAQQLNGSSVDPDYNDDLLHHARELRAISNKEL
ncbi:hypothetical protein LTR56_024100, partial [Elasticomyces elasticus]